MIVLIHYNEIGLKGGNRVFFEKKLAGNIKSALRGAGDFFVKRERGRITVRNKGNQVNRADRVDMTNRLRKVFGIAYFAFAKRIRIDTDYTQINTDVYDMFRNYKENKKIETFKIQTKRSDKNFPSTSQEVNEQVGEFIKKKTKMKVDLENPDITFFIEIADKEIYIYFEKIKGFGGLPVGAEGKALSLISSGIDSPVASWYLMKRGCFLDFIHFHGYPQTGKASIDNVKKIIGVLNEWQDGCHSQLDRESMVSINCIDSRFRGDDKGGGKLYLVPLLEIQKEIIKEAPEDYRVMMYRYFMFKIAAAISGYKALVTGENLGQVASQTLDNIYALENSLKSLPTSLYKREETATPSFFKGGRGRILEWRGKILPIFRPLIGMDKEEIIRKAKDIGTYDISIKPYEDCCSFFVPKHPVTKANADKILKMAEKINKKIIKQALDNTEIINF